jgi:hypothetical protein
MGFWYTYWVFAGKSPEKTEKKTLVSEYLIYFTMGE